MLYMYNKGKIPTFAIFDQEVLHVHCFHWRLNEEKYKEGFLLPKTFKLLGGWAQVVQVRQPTTAHLGQNPVHYTVPHYIVSHCTTPHCASLHCIAIQHTCTVLCYCT